MKRMTENQITNLGRQRPMEVREEVVEAEIKSLNETVGTMENDAIVAWCDDATTGLHAQRTVKAYDLGVATTKGFITTKHRLRQEMRDIDEKLAALKDVRRRARDRINNKRSRAAAKETAA